MCICIRVHMCVYLYVNTLLCAPLGGSHGSRFHRLNCPLTRCDSVYSYALSYALRTHCLLHGMPVYIREVVYSYALESVSTFVYVYGSIFSYVYVSTFVFL